MTNQLRGLTLTMTGIIGLIGGLAGLTPAQAATTATATSSAVSTSSSSVVSASSSSTASSSSSVASSSSSAVKPKPKTTTRTATQKLTAKAYFSVKAGNTYAFSGDNAHVTMHANHKLSNYTKTTWTATAQTDVTTPKGQTTRYLLVKDAKNGAQGWVVASNLKAGRNYQVSAVKKLKAKNYVYLKAGKVYQKMNGKASAMQWVKGKSLTKTQTYKATQQRTYYRQGKAYIYYYVTSTKGVKGWVWHKQLKAGTYYDVAKRQKALKSKLQKYLNSVTKDGTAEVAFYNLSPIAGSQAAKAPHASVYQAGKLAVNARGNQVTTSASTYKLYIAAYVLHLKQQHKWSWSKANTKGMHDMIVISDNHYPVSILNKYGRTNINHWLASQGYYGAPFSSTRNSMTTANSLIKVLKDLQNGQKAFSNKSDRAKVLKLMHQQIYRKGIPTGAAAALKGSSVQDKVGFLYDNNGDAGIVTLPNGPTLFISHFDMGASAIWFFRISAELPKSPNKFKKLSIK